VNNEKKVTLTVHYS